MTDATQIMKSDTNRPSDSTEIDREDPHQLCQHENIERMGTFPTRDNLET